MDQERKYQSGDGAHAAGRAKKPARGKPVIMHSMRPKPGESDEAWAKRCVKELKIALARQAGLID